MHLGELSIDATLARRLLEAQFPAWADLPLAPLPLAGTDNALFRLGASLTLRFPRIGWAAGQPEKEFRWLPSLAPRLPLPIPTPLALGQPGEGYPYCWSVCPWMEGRNATPDALSDLSEAAATLAGFITALQSIDASGGPASGKHNSGRGVALKTRDKAVRAAIAQLVEQKDPLEPKALLDAWEESLSAPEHIGPPVWLHGDLQPGNLLAIDGKLSGVIDFGCLGVGDPACDLQPAWNLFDRESRQVFREALKIDDAAWERGRGWALSVGLIALPYYKETAPAIAHQARRTIEELLFELRQPI